MVVRVVMSLVLLVLMLMLLIVVLEVVSVVVERNVVVPKGNGGMREQPQHVKFTLVSIVPVLDQQNKAHIAVVKRNLWR